MKSRVLVILLFSAVLINCNKSSNPATPAAAADVPVITIPPGSSPWTPPVNGPGQGPGAGFTWGGTATFQFDSKGVYNQYVGYNRIQDLSQLQNVAINLNFDKYNNTYGGTVTIRYVLGGQVFNGYFTSGNDAKSNRYNIWFTRNGARYWHGFFEDFMGGLVVVINDASQLNDGASQQDTVSGSVWFKNFSPSPDPHPPTYCWFLIGGPFDCRAWKTADGVNTTLGVNPDAGYTRLGTFTGMPVLKAFNAQTL